jgi:hypothetical protein
MNTNALKSRWVFGLSFLLAGLVILTGCSTGPDDSIVGTLEDLSGVWHRTEVHAGYGEVYWAFYEDGSYRVATGSADRVETHPLAEGEVWFEEGQLRIKDTTDSLNWPSCLGSGEVGTYEVRRAADGTIEFVLTGEPCGGGARGKVLTGSYELVP